MDTMESVFAKILDIFETNEGKKSELLIPWHGMKIEARFNSKRFTII
jgi:hypothetical protein